MFEPGNLLVLIPLLPLAASIATAVIGPRWLRQHSHWPALLGIGGSFVCSLLLLLHIQTSGVAERQLWHWARVAGAYDPVAAPADTVAAEGQSRAFSIQVALRADPLTAIMLVMVTFVSSLVAIYSVGYMRGDRGYWRFFAYVALFVFSMTMLVSVSNFALLYVFWEAVGVSSYLLIGFWYEKSAAAAAGKKAFLVNRVGDFGFALALFLIWITYGTLDFYDTENVAGVFGQRRLSGEIPFAGGGVGLAICLLLLLGACGKSAQFPLHVWLPDAMEGPTPVSALIHAATMVTAGVYLVARSTPLFMVSPDAQLAVSLIGGLSALLAATIALTQFDLKRVLAYSTISQLGYMFVALGTGSLAGITAGMFHLFTHAFFKALLFLGAGSVMHATGGVIDLRRLGGLRKKMPITHWTFAFGCLALAGVIPFAGFWSKDAVLASVDQKVHQMREATQIHGDVGEANASPLTSQLNSAGRALSPEASAFGPHVAPSPEASAFGSHGALSPEASAFGSPRLTPQWIPADRARGLYQLVYYGALVTAFLTALYTFRAFFMTFYGVERIGRRAHHHAHESPRWMWIPLAVLAGFALAVGLVVEQTHVFANLLARTPVLAYETVRATARPAVFHRNVALASTAMALAGVGLAAYLYLGPRREARALKYAFSLGWLDPVARRPWVARLSGLAPVVTIKRAADRVRLGWLIRLAGYAMLPVVYLLSWCLLLAHSISPYRLSYGKFFFDEIYRALFVWPLWVAAKISFVVDQYLIDALVDFCGRVPVWVGGLLRTLHAGLLSFYALAMALGITLTLVLLEALWGGG
jgi:NADH-quinone oxidoreductase subunit L